MSTQGATIYAQWYTNGTVSWNNTSSGYVLSGDSVTLSWTGAAGTNNALTKYELKSGSTVLYSGTNTSYTISNFTTTASYTVTATYALNTVTTASITKTVYTHPTLGNLSGTSPIPSGSKPTISWSAATAGTNNAVTGYQWRVGTGTWSSTITDTSFTASSAITSSTTYGVRAVGTRGDYSAEKTITIAVWTNASSSLSVSPTSVASGNNAVLSYSATSGTNNSITGWTLKEGTTTLTSGTGAASSTYTVTPVTPGTHTYTLTATSTYNTISDKTVTVTVTGNTLTVNPNGGIWNGNSTTRTYTQAYGSTLSIPTPVRAGYKFVGWAEVGSGRLGKINNADPSFDTSNGGVGVYNNSGGGTVTHARQSSAAPSTYGSNEILISSSSGTTSPGLGGFYQGTSSAANKKFVHAFVAKVPVGYSVYNAQNSTGDGRTITWITDTAGTGEYTLYAYQHNCGSTGTFSTFGHVYIVSGTKPMSWNLAYSAMTEITNG